MSGTRAIYSLMSKTAAATNNTNAVVSLSAKTHGYLAATTTVARRQYSACACASTSTKYSAIQQPAIQSLSSSHFRYQSIVSKIQNK